MYMAGLAAAAAAGGRSGGRVTSEGWDAAAACPPSTAAGLALVRDGGWPLMLAVVFG